MRRSLHAACCLNYGQDHPQLLVYGGLDNGNKALEDMWILDVDTVQWAEVTPPESMTPRYYHSITATSLGPGLTEVLVFGGKRKMGEDVIAETTVLRFELTGPSASVAGPSAGKWALVDMAHNDTRGSAQRLREKMIRQATARASSVSETSDHSSQDRVRALEQQLRAAEQREHDTQRYHQLQLQEKNREITAQAIELTEANRRHGDAEERAQLAEQREQATQLLLQVKDRELAEANRREADLSARITALEWELEGKTKELAAHNTEVWRIPANRVIIGRRIGKGGWGEVLEGTVSVAVKRLHEEIALPIYIEKMEREMKLLAEVRHPNLVQFIGAIFDEPNQAHRSPPLIITELLDMNLRQAYERNQLDPGNRLSIFMDIALALNYLHQRYDPIIHRDVSAPNVLLQRMPNHQWKGKVSDLGSANFLQHAHTMGEGAIIYSPPEVIPQAFDPLTPPLRQSVNIDVYSYGIVLCEVTASRFPSAEHYRDMILQVQRQRPAVYELILHCTKREPSHRPSMAQVMVELNKIAPF
ncbi:probable serine/threonine-protein kinase drkD [Halichondria panicea]|uniref:probable serine/threonine-protein kinase drkD n=1 Tax=Halichondria panicea TaxID=6063 RepID=UPI00312BAF52